MPWKWKIAEYQNKSPKFLRKIKDKYSFFFFFVRYKNLALKIKEFGADKF